MSLRVSERYLSSLMIRSLQRSAGQVVRYQQMAANFRRINSFADDPRAIGTISLYNNLLSRNDQYLRNASRSRTFVEGTDSALQSIVETLHDTRELVMRESSALGTPESQDIAVGVVDNLIERLLSALNTTVEGDHIFGGHRTSQLPFLRSGDAVVYQGDAGQIIAQVGPHTDLVLNIPGNALLGSNTGLLRGTQDVALPVLMSTSLTDLNLGSGWQPGSIMVQDGTGATHTIDLSGASSVSDVVGLIGSSTLGAVIASIAPDGQSLQLSGTGPLTVSEVGDGTTAQSLGLLGSSPTDQLVGRDIRPAPTLSTPLSDIPALSGRLPLGAVIVSLGDQETTVDFSGAATLQDLQSLLAAAVPELELRPEGGMLVVVSNSSQSFSIRNAPGSTAASDLGLAGTGSPARLLEVMFTLKQALASHDQTAVRGTLTELEAVLQNVLAHLIEIGDTQNILDSADSYLRARDERLQAGLSREKDADIATVAMELSKAEAAYESSLMVSSRLLEMNLLHFLG
jgi:flagellar hook-associated protein 3 FlgL